MSEEVSEEKQKKSSNCGRIFLYLKNSKIMKRMKFYSKRKHAGHGSSKKSDHVKLSRGGIRL